RWPGRLPRRATSPQVAITMDLTASILAATRTAAPAGYLPEGVNLLPTLTGQTPLIERQLFWRIQRPMRQQKAVRASHWKMLVDGGVYLLFDLSNDPGERHDLAAQHPEIIVRLKADLSKWEQAVSSK